VSTPTQEQLLALWEHCGKFVKDQVIICPETIYQTDRVIGNACEFIEGVCGIVGYVEIRESMS